jgi:hypothetical protein
LAFSISEPFWEAPHLEKYPSGSFIDEAHDISWYKKWNVFVAHQISCRELSFKTDVFPCISGIAAAAAKAGGDEYVAGIWQNDLATGLLWTKLRSHRTATETQQEYLMSLEYPSPYIAPSWSWAAHRNVEFVLDETHRCNWDYINNRQESRIRACVEPLTASPFGQLAGGRLELYGVVKTLSAASGFSLEQESEDTDDPSFASHYPLEGSKTLKEHGGYFATVVLDWDNESLTQEVEGLRIALLNSCDVLLWK